MPDSFSEIFMTNRFAFDPLANTRYTLLACDAKRQLNWPRYFEANVQLYHPALVAELAANEAPLHGKNSVSTNNSVSGTIPNNLGSAKSLNQLYVRVTSDLGNFNSGTDGGVVA